MHHFKLTPTKLNSPFNEKKVTQNAISRRKNGAGVTFPNYNCMGSKSSQMKLMDFLSIQIHI